MEIYNLFCTFSYDYIKKSPYINTVLSFLVLMKVTCLLTWFIKDMIPWLTNRLLMISGHGDWNKYLTEHKVYKNIWYTVPFFIIFIGIDLIPNIDIIVFVISKISHICIWYFVFSALIGILSSLQDLYDSSSKAQTRSIKGYIQIAKLLLIAICFILILSLIINKSPLWMMSGLGAISAVLLLVFKDTLLSLVASTQLITNDMLRIGDWIEMPQSNADGFVKDIALHTVKVQNWDNTVTTVPTYKLFSESYRNYRQMFESGGRRIKRTLRIDINSIRCLNEKELILINDNSYISKFLEKQNLNISNISNLTNIAILRLYTIFYLESHPELRKDMPIIVRTLESLSDGIPIEIYCFTSLTAWVEYERIQANIFDHLIIIIPYLHIKLFQHPSGHDLPKKFSYFGV